MRSISLTTMLGLMLILVGCDRPNLNSPTDVSDRSAAPARDAKSGDTVTSPDNTAVNERDASGDTKTPIDQNENQADINLVAKIRQQVLDVKDLSVNARNAKIIVANGKVTLRGPVESDEERATLERIAREAAGDGNVTNQLEVAARP